jgi:hypothetical protein
MSNERPKDWAERLLLDTLREAEEAYERARADPQRYIEVDRRGVARVISDGLIAEERLALSRGEDPWDDEPDDLLDDEDGEDPA